MVSRRRELPGEPNFARQAVWSSGDRAITVFALLLPLALMVDGLIFTSAVAWTGGIATGVTGIFLVSLWSLETRTVAIGTGWLAVRARLAPSWVVVPASDIVAVQRRRFIKSGLAIKLTSGPPVFVRRGDLEAGIAAAMSEDLGLKTPMEVALAELHAEQEAGAAETSGDATEEIVAVLAGRDPGRPSTGAHAEEPEQDHDAGGDPVAVHESGPPQRGEREARLESVPQGRLRRWSSRLDGPRR